MKTQRKILLAGSCFLTLFLLGGCAALVNLNVMSTKIPSELGSLTAMPGSDESVLFVKRGDTYGETVVIKLNDQKIFVLGKSEEGRLIIPNGEHIITAEISPEQKAKAPQSVGFIDGTKEISAHSAQIRITATVIVEDAIISFNMEEVGQ
jgi:hypothetical protein